jgi:hypothetical protein
MISTRPTRGAGCVAIAALLAGCASSPQLDAQWSDPQRPPNLLRGAKVMVACEAPDLALKRICQDQLSSEVVARGGTPVAAPDTGSPAPTSEPYLAAARSAGARAIWTNAVTVAAAGSSPGLSIGLGAFGIGGGSVRGGVGVSAPIGGGRVTSGYSANGRVTDVPSGRLVWTAKATSSPSSDVNAQMAELSRVVIGAAEKSGLF